MKKLSIVIAIIIVLGLVGWGAYSLGKSKNTSNSNGTSQSSSTSTSSSSTQPATGSIDIKNMMFTPSQITVAKGGTVTWTNNDTTAHTVTDDLSNVGGPNSGEIAPGATYSFTFTKTGSFQYHCTIHPSMRGTIVVK